MAGALRHFYGLYIFALAREITGLVRHPGNHLQNHSDLLRAMPASVEEEPGWRDYLRFPRECWSPLKSSASA